MQFFLETMNHKLSFATGFKFLAPLVAAHEFFQIRVRVALEGLFGVRPEVENRSKIEKVRLWGYEMGEVQHRYGGS